MKTMQLLTLAFVMFLGGLTTTKAQTAEDIVQKHIEAIGGADNWKKINSIKMTGITNAQGQEIPVVVTTLNGKGTRQDITINGMLNYNIITPTAGWQYFPIGGQTKPEVMTSDAVKDGQDGLDIQGPLIDYKAKGNKIEYLGKDDVEGTDCYKVKLVHKNGKEETLYFDASNYYQIRSVEKQKVNGQEQDVTTDYSNYQKLPEGIVFPMTVGSPQGEVTFKSVEVNKPIDETIFKPAN